MEPLEGGTGSDYFKAAGPQFANPQLAALNLVPRTMSAPYPGLARKSRCFHAVVNLHIGFRVVSHSERPN